MTFQNHFSGRLQSDLLEGFIAKDSAPQAGMVQFTRRDQILFVKENALAPIDLTSAEEYLKKKLGAVLQIYQTHDSPYPGFLSKTIKCEQTYLPKEFSLRIDAQNPLRAVELYANSRMIFGSCSAENAQFKAVYAVLVCTKNSVAFELSWFGAIADASISAPKFVESLRCP